MISRGHDRGCENRRVERFPVQIPAGKCRVQVGICTAIPRKIDSTFAPERVIAILDKMQSELRPEIEEHLLRWSSDTDAVAKWESEVDVMREFALKRPDSHAGINKETFRTGYLLNNL